MAGTYGHKDFRADTASSHGLIGLTKCAARERGHRGIRVSCVSP